MKDLSKLWDEPLVRCGKKGIICAYALRGDTLSTTKCALDNCVKYKKRYGRYESNASRPR